MIGSYFRSLAPLAFLSLLLGGCSGGSIDDFAPDWFYADVAPDTIQVPAAQTVAVADLPQDAQAVLRAVVLRLHGHDSAAVDAAAKVTGSDLVSPEPAFTYDGFTVHRVKLVGHTPAANVGDEGMIHAMLGFDDRVGRSAAASVVASYRRDASGLTLTQVGYRPLYAAHPRVELLIVPAEALKAQPDILGAGYADLRGFAEQNAIAMRDPAASNGAAGEYVAIAFLRDRIGSGATLAMRLSDQRRGVRGYAADTRYLAFEPGWGAALAPGVFALAADKSFWIKVVYDPKGAVPGAGRGERVIGLFSTAPTTAAK